MTQNDIYLEPLTRGWPGTVRFRVPEAEGGPAHGYRIVPLYLTPLARPLIGAVLAAGLLGTLGFVATTLASTPTQEEFETAILAYGAMLVLGHPVNGLLRLVFASAGVIEIAPGHVSVLGWTGECRYARDVPVGFELRRHWKFQRAVQSGLTPPKRLIEGFQIVLRRDHEAVVIANVYGKARAQELLDQLNRACAATTT